MRRTALTAIAVLGCSIAAADTTSYICKYSVEATPTGLTKQVLELRYILNSKTQKAYLLGNAGSSEVQVIPNIDGISFVEITDSGNVMVTAITTSGESVHSRNGILSDQLVPSQYYGKCIQQ